MSLGSAVSSNGDGTMTIVQQTSGKTDNLYLPTAQTAPVPADGRATYLPNSFKVLVVAK